MLAVAAKIKVPMVETNPVYGASCPTSLGSATNSYIEILVFSVNKYMKTINRQQKIYIALDFDLKKRLKLSICC